jgi:hypothetical protein
MEMAEKLAAKTGFETMFDPEKQAGQQQRPCPKRPQIVCEGVPRRGAQFTFDDGQKRHGVSNW